MMAKRLQDTLFVFLPFKSESFEQAWNDWNQFRREIKKPLRSNKSAQLQLDFLAKFDEKTAIEIINQSIRNEWQGLFELKTTNQNKNGKFTTEREQRNDALKRGAFNKYFSQSNQNEI